MAGFCWRWGDWKKPRENKGWPNCLTRSNLAIAVEQHVSFSPRAKWRKRSDNSAERLIWIPISFGLLHYSERFTKNRASSPKPSRCHGRRQLPAGWNQKKPLKTATICVAPFRREAREVIGRRNW